MSETRSLVERKMERIRPPSFSYEDLLARRDRKVRNQRLVAGIAAFVLFAAVAAGAFAFLRESGSQPASDGTTKATFVREASAICQEGQAEFRRLVPLRSPRADWSLERKIAYYRTGFLVFGETATRLRALTPPPGLEEEVDAMLHPFERHLDAVSRAIWAGAGGNRYGFNRSIARAFGPLASAAEAAFEEFDPGLSCP